MQNRTEERPLKRILVVNYDQCAFTQFGTHPNMLSKPLLTFAQSPAYHFDGFYGLTSRHAMSIAQRGERRNNEGKVKFRSIHEAGIQRLAGTHYTVTEFKKNWQTYRITDNFTQASGLHCYAVASPEDYHKQLGRGFTHVIKPFELSDYEKQEKIKIPDNAITPLDVAKMTRRHYLLTRIAKDAAKNYPNSKIQLVYVDDNITHINKASGIPLQARNGNEPRTFKPVTEQRDWPENVSVDFYKHSVTKKLGDETPLSFVKSLTPPMPVVEDEIPNVRVTDVHSSFFNSQRSTSPAAPTPSPVASLRTSADGMFARRSSPVLEQVDDASLRSRSGLLTSTGF